MSAFLKNLFKLKSFTPDPSASVEDELIKRKLWLKLREQDYIDGYYKADKALRGMARLDAGKSVGSSAGGALEELQTKYSDVFEEADFDHRGFKKLTAAQKLEKMRELFNDQKEWDEAGLQDIKNLAYNQVQYLRSLRSRLERPVVEQGALNEAIRETDGMTPTSDYVDFVMEETLPAPADDSD